MRYGDTTVLSTATASDKPREGIDFFPLSVEYEEKMYAVGKIPGGFNKREGKASEHAILTSRVIDRPMRPLFPKDYRNDVTLKMCIRDRFHRGHQKLVEGIKQKSGENCRTIIFTFDLSCKAYQKKCVPKLLLTYEEKREIAEALHADILAECPFTEELMNMEPEADVYKRQVLYSVAWEEITALI